MSYQDLSNEAMLAISNAWLSPQHLKPLLDAVIVLSSFLHQLQRRHDDLLAAVNHRPSPHDELRALQEQATALDKVHDRQVRGIYHVLHGLEILSVDTDLEVPLSTLRDHIYTQGLRVVSKNFREQAGYAQALVARLTPAQRQTLASLPTPWGSLDDHLSRWLETAAALVLLEDRRSALSLSLQDTPPPVTLHQARRNWIRTVQLFAELIDELHDTGQFSTATQQQLLSDLHRALGRA
jgi:hypothetical protein